MKRSVVDWIRLGLLIAIASVLILLPIFVLSGCTQDVVYDPVTGKPMVRLQSNAQRVDYMRTAKRTDFHIYGMDNATTTAAAYNGGTQLAGVVGTSIVSAVAAHGAPAAVKAAQGAIPVGTAFLARPKPTPTPTPTPKPMISSHFKLGKLPVRHDPRTLHLSAYLRAAALPPAPVQCDWGAKVKSWPMMANDRLGDCTCAAAGHLIQEWTTDAQAVPVVLPDSAIIAAYSRITGYNPTTGANDNGAVEIDVLNYWRKTGFAGHKIDAYAAISRNQAHTKSAISIFGGIYIGVALPLTAQGQNAWWIKEGDLKGQGAPGSWGGHAVPVIGYDPEGLDVITWGERLRMSWAFWAAYVEEAYAILSPDFLNANQIDPAGFDLAALQADLAAITK